MILESTDLNIIYKRALAASRLKTVDTLLEDHTFFYVRRKAKVKNRSS